MNIKTLEVCSIVPAGELASNRWKACKHNNRSKVYIHDFYNGYIEWYCLDCGITLDKPEDRPKKPQYRKLAVNERVCPVCGRIFRVKRNQRNAKYCCNDHYIIAKNKKTKHRNGLGTTTVSLGEKSIKKQLSAIRSNYDEHADKIFTTESRHEIASKETCYYPGSGENNYEYIE